ncbi:MAG: hypothetical protein WBA61_01090 [Aequorivita sp.]
MKNRKRNRLWGYDYSRDDLYYVTICVRGMICCFGEIIPAPIPNPADPSFPNSLNPPNPIPSPKTMSLNEYGGIVQAGLLWLPDQYPYVVLHNYVVMPNHVHAIIEIDSSKVKNMVIKIKSLSSLIGAFETTSPKMIHIAGYADFFVASFLLWPHHQNR